MFLTAVRNHSITMWTRTGKEGVSRKSKHGHVTMLNVELSLLCCRALQDIRSGPKIRRIFKIRTVHIPDFILPRCRTFSTIKNRRKSKKKKIILILNFFIKFFVIKGFLQFLNFQIHLNLDFNTKFVSSNLA